MITPVAQAPLRLPVSVITGFLGSGKTTFLNRLLRDPVMAGSLVIVNEFGEMGLDHLLIETPADNMVLLENGCLCCTNRGDLVETLDAVYRRWKSNTPAPFNRVVIETSGLADPVAIMQTVVRDDRLSHCFRMERVVTLVDGVNGDAQLDTYAEPAKQIVVADNIILSKIDIASPAAVTALRARVADLNAGAEIITAAHGNTDIARIFGAARPGHADRHIERWLGVPAPRRGSPVAARYGGTAAHTQGINTISLRYEQPVRWSGLTLWLEMLSALRGMDLLRVKGLLDVEGQPVVIHAVQSIVHEPEVLTAWPATERGSRLVFITRNLNAEDLQRTLAVLSYEGPAADSGFGVDPAAYRTFLDAASRFG